jgi:hypothetical protein
VRFILDGPLTPWDPTLMPRGRYVFSVRFILDFCATFLMLPNAYFFNRLIWDLCLLIANGDQVPDEPP